MGQSKKHAIVQAALNMLKQLFPLGENAKESQGWSEQSKAEKMNIPWKCHFCKIFTNRRKSFLSHLIGRSHIKKISELNLNVEEQNKKLAAEAEQEFEKKEGAKLEFALEKCLQGLTKEHGCKKIEDAFTQSDKIFDRDYSSQDSDKSKSSSIYSSEKSGVEVSCLHSNSYDMKAIE